MSHVTVGQVLARLDALTPNPCTAEQKRHWLHQAECFAAQTVGLPLPAAPLEDEGVLLAPVPYDGLYLRYLEAQIHYAGGEMQRYNNAVTAWNELLLTWRDYLRRGGAEPAQAHALKLC